MNIIIFGPHGAGKGTYTEILSKKYKIPHISPGQLFRDEIKKKSELGKKVEKIVNHGKLVPDGIVIRVVKERLKKDDCKNGFLLDGFPRTIPQAKALEKFTRIDKVLNFTASEEVIMDRMSGRRTCKNCGAIYHERNVPSKVRGVCDRCGGELYQRYDETPEAIMTMTKEYNKKTKPLIDYYKKEGLLADIDANPPIEEVDKVISQCDKELSKIKKK